MCKQRNIYTSSAKSYSPVHAPRGRHKDDIMYEHQIPYLYIWNVANASENFKMFLLTRKQTDPDTPLKSKADDSSTNL